MIDERTTSLIKAFEYGIDYGLLIAEQERDSEDLFDAFQCGEASRRYNVPSAPAPRRQAHSEEWRKAKCGALAKFIELVAKENDNDSKAL